MRKSKGVIVAAVAAIAGLIACAPQDQARVCVDKTNRVVPADLCEQQPRTAGGVYPYFWYYHAVYSRGGYPATGTAVARGGSFSAPAHAVSGARTSVRGGFGHIGSGHAGT